MFGSAPLSYKLCALLKALIFAENVIYSYYTMNNAPRPAPHRELIFSGVSEEASKEA
jgi:hypothetical protein